MSLFRKRLLARLIEAHAIPLDLVKKLLAWNPPVSPRMSETRPPPGGDLPHPSEQDLLRLKRIAKARRSSPGDTQDIALLEARRKTSKWSRHLGDRRLPRGDRGQPERSGAA